MNPSPVVSIHTHTLATFISALHSRQHPALSGVAAPSPLSSGCTDSSSHQHPALSGVAAPSPLSSGCTQPSQEWLHRLTQPSQQWLHQLIFTPAPSLLEQQCLTSYMFAPTTFIPILPFYILYYHFFSFAGHFCCRH